jgi:hypothetical protein
MFSKQVSFEGGNRGSADGLHIEHERKSGVNKDLTVFI